MINDKSQNTDEKTENSLDTDEKKLKRVCLYVAARDKDQHRTKEFMDQQLTLIHLINNTPGWKYKKIYMDDVGEHTRFDEMITDCEAGKYDIVVTKSILQFDKTIFDTIKLARRLAEKDPPVEIIFTDQALFSLDKERLKDMEIVIIGEVKDDATSRKESSSMNRAYFIRAWNGRIPGKEEGE